MIGLAERGEEGERVLQSFTTAARQALAAALLAGLGVVTACSPGPGPEGTAATVTPQAPPLPGQGEDSDAIVIYRDTWGIPHIYSPTVAGGLYAMGYAQAQDRPAQLLTNLKIALGELSELAGESQIPQDLMAHLFDHHGIAARQWPKVSPS
jgi:acyl-homoserine lactone acylase PvdQ